MGSRVWTIEAIPAGDDPICGAAILQLTCEPIIYCEAPGGEPRHLIAEEPFNHLAASDDGRCESWTRQGRPQHTHAHPYMTPDNRHVIFNSNITGVWQVYAARIPNDFLNRLEA